MSSSLTIGECFQFLAKDEWKKIGILKWPPDVFALCGYVLEKSGAYLHLSNSWPPANADLLGSKNWRGYVTKLGDEWWISLGWNAPHVWVQVEDLWYKLLSHADVHLDDLQVEGKALESPYDDVVFTLISLAVAADEASKVLSPWKIPGKSAAYKVLKRLAYDQIDAFGENATLCQKVSSDTQRVLHKFHTPRSGFSFRNMTHYLALCPSGEVKPNLDVIPNPLIKQPDKLSVFLFPWPHRIDEKQFTLNRKPRRTMKVMPRGVDFFSFRHADGDPGIVLRQILDGLAARGDFPDLIVLPELSLDEVQLQSIRGVVESYRLPCSIIAGVGISELDYSCNEVRFLPGLPDLEMRQRKHHRWKLTPGQILRYKLESVLPIKRSYLEDLKLEQRCIGFFQLAPNFSACCLICEDLARHEPVGGIVRSMGPDIVFALLMDGPQYDFRWPGRYATVLAEESGSSVLTMTCLGMTGRSDPPANTIALWRGADNPTSTEICLATGETSILLRLERRACVEFTLDGRKADSRSTWLLNECCHLDPLGEVTQRIKPK